MVNASPVQHVNGASSPPPKPRTSKSRRGTRERAEEDSVNDNVHELDAIPAIAALRTSPSPPPLPQQPTGPSYSPRLHPQPHGVSLEVDTNTRESWKDDPTLQRFPSTTPALLPEHRYCYKDEFIKPPRTHHCRICGTVGVYFELSKIDEGIDWDGGYISVYLVCSPVRPSLSVDRTMCRRPKPSSELHLSIL